MYWEQLISLVGETACNSDQREWRGKCLTTHNNQPVSSRQLSSPSSSQPTTIRPSTVSQLLTLMNQNTQLTLRNPSLAKLCHTGQLQKASNTNRVLRTASTARPTSSYLTRSPNQTSYSEVVTADDTEEIDPYENTTTTPQELQRTVQVDDYSVTSKMDTEATRTSLASSTSNSNNPNTVINNGAAKSQQTCHPISPHLTTTDTRPHHTAITAAASTSAYRQNYRRIQTIYTSKGVYWLYCGSWIESLGIKSNLQRLYTHILVCIKFSLLAKF